MQKHSVPMQTILKNHPYQAGDRLIQKQLAATLKEIAEKGPDVFYRGPIADKIVSASRVHGGLLSAQDFKEYTVEELTPIQCTYHEYTILSSPPPSSGGVSLCEMLNIVKPYPLS